MLQSAVLDVAMGVVFVFLLVSLLVTAATEMFAGLLKWRATSLWDGIARLLQSEEARTQLYDHPLIRGLASRPLTARGWNDGRVGPSYIPSRTFALALIDLLREPRQMVDRVRQDFDRVAADAKSNPSGVFDALHDVVTRLAAAAPPNLRDDLLALQQRVLTPADTTVVEQTKADLRQVVSLLPPPAAPRLQAWLDQAIANGEPYAAMRKELSAILAAIPAGAVAAVPARPVLRRAVDRMMIEGDPEAAVEELNAFAGRVLLRWATYATGGVEQAAGSLWPLLDQAAGDVDRFRENVETWFNDGMDRVSGSYKRHTQAWQFGIALALAAALNIDALLIVRTLWQDPALRQAIASQASAVVANPPASLQPSPTAAKDPTAQLSVRLSSASVEAGDTVTAYVELTGDANREVEVSTTSSHLAILDSAGQPQTTLKVPVPAGQTAGIELLAKSVASDTLEQFRISRQTQVVQPEVVVRPSASQRFDAAKSQIGGLGLPIGWGTCKAAGGLLEQPFWCAPPGAGYSNWLLVALPMLLGWLITSAAASLGAPFWFDTLSRVASIKSAGKTPETPPKPATAART